MTNGAIARSQDGTSIGYETLGAGDGLLVLGGGWRTSRDYLPLARRLAHSFAVHVIDRRGRGRSGAQGPAYTIERELEDLAAVQAHTRVTASDPSRSLIRPDRGLDMLTGWRHRRPQRP
jgi:pimeloyl-ACP methyl ester carboxylesterase